MPGPVTPVPRLTAGGMVICVATGPSLTPEDVASCRGRGTVVVVNDAYCLAPWADVLMASDAMWWRVHHDRARSFRGLKYTLDPQAAKWAQVQVLRNTGDEGLETDPTGLRNGRNSGYAAINLAVHLGAARIVLLGYDMRLGRNGRAHYFGDHPRPLRNRSPFALFQRSFPTAVEPLRRLGIDVVNCSRESAIKVFPRRPLSDVLAAAGQEAVA